MRQLKIIKNYRLSILNFSITVSQYKRMAMRGDQRSQALKLSGINPKLRQLNPVKIR
jgi:hypothetical protein